MGRLARHRKIKKVNQGKQGNKQATDPSKNKPPSKKEEEEFRKIMAEWNAPPPEKKKKTQSGGSAQQQSSKAKPAAKPSTPSSSAPVVEKDRPEKKKRKRVDAEEDEWIELDLGESDGPVSLNNLLNNKQKAGPSSSSLDSLLKIEEEAKSDDDDDDKKKKKKKKAKRALGRIENIDVNNDELGDLTQNPSLPTIRPGETYSEYMRRLKGATRQALKDTSVKFEKKPLRESRKKHLKKREEKKKKNKGGQTMEDASKVAALNAAIAEGPQVQSLVVTTASAAGREEKVKFFDQVMEPPKLPVPLNAKKQKQLAAKKAEEKQKKKEEESKDPKAKLAQRSMELLRDRAVANYKLAKQREKQKRAVVEASATTSSKKKAEEPAASYL